MAPADGNSVETIKDGLKYNLSPLPSVRFCDSHLHLADFQVQEPILNYASASETLLVTAGTEEKSSAAGLEMARRNQGLVTAFVGVHPAESWRKDTSWLEDQARGASGIGEIGLDLKYSSVADLKTQESLFRSQLELAERLSKPVQVHSRNSEAKCLEVLSSYRLRVLMHWYEGEELAGEVVSRGYYASFGPALLYSKKLERIASAFPTDLVLTESDGPVKFGPLGGVAGPALIPSIVFRLARLKGIDIEEMREMLAKSASRFLGPLGKG